MPNTRAGTTTNEHTPDGGNHPDEAPQDATAKSDVPNKERDAEEAKTGLYVIVAQTREGGRLVELHDDESGPARYHELTYRGEDDGNGTFMGGGSHEIKPADIKVYKLNSSSHTF